MNLGDLLKQKIEGWQVPRVWHRLHPLVPLDLHLLCGAGYDEEMFRRMEFMNSLYPYLYQYVRSDV